MTGYWFPDWIWGVPLIILTVLAHAFSLFGMLYRIVPMLARYYDPRAFRILFILVLGTTVLMVTLLHAAHAAVWAVVYLLLGALPTARSAMLYSLEAMTAYGHSQISLEDRWQMMGALEALNGLILFGLTTAFLVAIIQGAAQRRAKEP